MDNETTTDVSYITEHTEKEVGNEKMDISMDFLKKKEILIWIISKWTKESFKKKRLEKEKARETEIHKNISWFYWTKKGIWSE